MNGAPGNGKSKSGSLRNDNKRTPHLSAMGLRLRWDTRWLGRAVGCHEVAFESFEDLLLA